MERIGKWGERGQGKRGGTVKYGKARVSFRSIWNRKKIELTLVCLQNGLRKLKQPNVL